MPGEATRYSTYLALVLLLWLILSVVGVIWSLFAARFWTFGLCSVSVIAVIFFLGRAQVGTWDAIKNWAQLLSFSGIILAAFGAYETYLTPFSPDVDAGTIQCRLGTNTYFPPSEMLIPLTFSNRGAASGYLNALAVVVSFPKGDCLFEPWFFVAADQYTRILTMGLANPGASTIPLKDPPFEAPFGPVLLAGRSQVSKAVIFGQAPVGCKPEYIEAGQHVLAIYGQYNHGKQKELRKLNFILAQDKIDQRKAGRTVAIQMMSQDAGWLNIPFRQ